MFVRPLSFCLVICCLLDVAIRSAGNQLALLFHHHQQCIHQRHCIMHATLYTGISIVGQCGKATILESPGCNVVYEGTPKIIGHEPGVDYVTQVANFVHGEIAKFKYPRNYVTSLVMAIALEHLFEYGESFPEQLRNALINSEAQFIETVTVLPLDAAAYLSCFDGVVINAGDGVSAAAKLASGSTTVIRERGHMIGDPGSAYWLSNKCLRVIYDNADGIELADYDLNPATKAVNEYFQLAKPIDILKDLYTDFSKEKIASFCGKIATLGRHGDPFCIYLFNEAGKKLGLLCKAVLARARKEKNDVLQMDNDGSLKLLGVGRVWEYYDLLRDGFLHNVKQSDLSSAVGKVHDMKIYKWMRRHDSHAVAMIARDLCRKESDVCVSSGDPAAFQLACVEKLY